MRRILPLLALVGLFFAGPAVAADKVDYDAVRSGLEKGEIVLVDIRETDEFTAGHVPGAINVPLSTMTPAALPKPDGKKVVIMCRSGNRTARLAAQLPGIGRGDVAEYSGSWLDWTARGGKVVTGR